VARRERRAGQWGTDPISADPRRREAAVRWAESHVILLVTDRGTPGRGIGGRLLDHARRPGPPRGVSLLRVDCYRGPDRALVRYYESQGFVATDEFTVDLPRGPWPGQVLEQRLA
jgi:GNAT superfamily N-acetyltransferase